eukprot:CAMPEP_0197433196 /NCGR_PEP_ID=MMETSP1175-20131217/1129_1 /TAXON_ID=1003142 /ORGANISM="Triceratium dubium, Strain CCMP147" /LENGTH=194 /DNA_ID=CAMNT_0042961501 /DNA_START=63 /DNA_END=647 /DNA_ORIENTATION=+
MVKLGLFVSALLASTACAFAPAAAPRNAFVTRMEASALPEVDSTGNNIAVKTLLTDIESSGLLTKVAEAGLLSKAQKAGISLTKLEPLIALAAENKDVLILVEAASPELLPLLPKIVELAPQALPLLGVLIQISPGTLQAGAAASLAAAAATVALVPDDTVLEVAAQTLAVAVLGGAIPIASVVGATIIGQLTK